MVGGYPPSLRGSALFLGLLARCCFQDTFVLQEPMSMIQTVGRAMFEEAVRENPEPPEYTEARAALYEGLARVAIAAMRNATLKMSEAGYHALGEGVSTLDAWEAMIDEALKP